MGCGGDAREGFYGNFSSLTASYERKFYAVVILLGVLLLKFTHLFILYVHIIGPMAITQRPL